MRYVVADGFAVVAHGHVRFTADLNLVLDLDEENAQRAVEALKSLDYHPRAPDAIEQFADANAR